MTKTTKRFSLMALTVCIALALSVFAVACEKPAAQKYTVDFDVQGHGLAPSAQSVEENGYAQEPTAPTAEGWDFGGWFKEAGCTNEFVFASEKITADTTVYAKWTEAEEKDPEVPSTTAATFHVYNTDYGTKEGAFDPETTFDEEDRKSGQTITYAYNTVNIGAHSAIMLMWHLDGCTTGVTYKFDIRDGENAQNDTIRKNFNIWNAVNRGELEYNIWNRTFGVIGLQIDFTAEDLSPEVGGAMCKVILENPTDTAYELHIVCSAGNALAPQA